MSNSGSHGPPPADPPDRLPRHSDVVPKAGGVRSASAQSAAELLLRALRAGTPEERQALANAGLSRLDREPRDDELKALLLRQIYLAQLEAGDFESALETAEEMVDLEELGDIARQDAARAAAGLGLIDVAQSHLEIAARISPDSRRAFHWATLGALLRFTGHKLQAISAFEKAVATAISDQALYQAQLALSERDAGRASSFSLEELRDRLESEPPSKGYVLWILGEVCSELGQDEKSRDYLSRFLGKMIGASRAKTLALRGELAHAEELLREIS